MSEPTITFTLNGATITAVETPAPTTFAPPPPEPETTTTRHTTTSSATPSEGSSFTTITTSKSSTTPVPSSCIIPITTVSDLSAARSLASACKTLSGSIVIPTGVSTPIDLTGMTELTGDLTCDGTHAEGFNMLSSNDMVVLGGNLNVQNNENLANVSFPAMATLGGLMVDNNANLHDFTSMTVLVNTSTSMDLNGSFSTISFPELHQVGGSFIVDSTVELDCKIVAPNLQKYHGTKSCHSTNSSMVTPSHNGTATGNVVYVPGGFTWKDKAIVGTICGVVALALIGIGWYVYIHRRQMKDTIALANESRANKRKRRTAERYAARRASQASFAASTPRTSPTSPGHSSPRESSFGVRRTFDGKGRAAPELYEELQELGRKANEHGLTRFERDRREFLIKTINDTVKNGGIPVVKEVTTSSSPRIE